MISLLKGLLLPFAAENLMLLDNRNFLSDYLTKLFSHHVIQTVYIDEIL